MDVFDLAAKITLDSSGFEKSLSAVGGSLKALAGISTAAVGSAVAGVTALAKQSMDSYASYEQLVGGVDTLFKDSTLKVQQYAENAYKTAGLSANEYMETVTSFSASLLQSLEGDTERAADVADVAIRDMSDNANKMGTAMESIQNAYQGFAKQNYTMLDNLKLGYGGTKAEMERLLADANELNEKQGIYTDYQIENYADIVEAIHVVQSEMGITGTTASEAASTIEGSMSSLKASWSNLLTELGKGGDVNKALENSGVEWEKYANKAWAASGAVEGVVDEIQYNLERINKGEGSLEELQEYLQLEYDMDSSDAVMAIEAVKNSMSNSQGIIDNFVQSLETAADNVIPRVVTVLGGIGTAIEHIAPIIAEEVPKLVQEVLPSLLTAAAGLVNSFAEAIRTALPTLVESITGALPTVIDALKNLLSNLLPAIKDAVGVLVANLPEIVSSLGEALSTLAPILVSNLAQLIQTLVVGVSNLLPTLLDAVLGLITSLGDAIIDNYPVIIEALYQLIPNIINFISDGIPKILETAEHLITKAVTELFPQLIAVVGEQLPVLIEALSQVIPKILTVVSEVVPRLAETIINNLPTLISTIIDVLPTIIESVINSLKDMYPAVHKAITTLITSLADLMPVYQEMVYELLPQLLEVIADLIVEFTPEIIDLIVGITKSVIEAWVEIIPSLLSNAWTVIKTALSTVGDILSDVLISAKEKTDTGIKTIIANVGEWLGQLPYRVGYFLTNTLASIIKWAIEAPAKMREAAINMITNVVEFVSKLPERVHYFITEVIPKIVGWGASMVEKGRQAALDFFNTIVNKIKELPGKMLSIGTDIVTGLWNGISSAKDWLAKQIGGFASGMVDGFKDAFGISSPSKVMRDSVGKFLADGIGVGFTDEMDNVIDDMTKAVDIDPFQGIEYGLPVESAFGASGVALGSNVVNNVSVSVSLDGARISDNLDLTELSDQLIEKISEGLAQLDVFNTRAYGGVTT